jgi:hypothetical protein
MFISPFNVQVPEPNADWVRARVLAVSMLVFHAVAPEALYGRGCGASRAQQRAAVGRPGAADHVLDFPAPAG